MEVRPSHSNTMSHSSNSGWLAKLTKQKQQSGLPIEFQELPKEVLLTMGERALTCPEEKERLWRYIIDSRNTSMGDRTSIAARNAITALSLAGFSFSGKDLNGINVPGADLSGGVFYGTNFSGANLEKVNFQQACLANAVLRNANLKNAEFGEFYLKDPNFPIENVKGLAVGGERIAVLSRNSIGEAKIHVWSYDGQHVCTWSAEDLYDRLPNIAFTNDGQNILFISQGFIQVWDAQKGILLCKLCLLEAPIYIHKADFDSAKNFIKELQPDNLKSLSNHSKYFEFNLECEKTLQIFQKHEEEGSKLIHKAFCDKKEKFINVSSSSKEPLIAANFNGKICVWDLKSQRLLHSIPFFREKSNHMGSGIPCFVDEDNILACTGDCVKLINLSNKKVIKTWASHTLLVCSPAKKLFVADYTKRFIGQIDSDLPLEIGNDLWKRCCQVYQSIALSNNGDKLAQYFKGTIQIWSTRNWTLVYSFGARSSVKDLKFIQNDQALVVSFGELVVVLNIPDSPTRSTNLNLGDIESFIISKNQNILISLSLKILRIWNLKTRELLQIKQKVLSCASSRDSKYLLMQLDNKAVLMDIEANKEIMTFDYKIQGVGFLSDNHAVMICEKSVLIYDCKNGKSDFILDDMRITKHFACSNNGQYLVLLLGYDKDLLRVWDADSKKCYELDLSETYPNIRYRHSSRIKLSGTYVINRYEAKDISHESHPSNVYIHIWNPLMGTQYHLKDVTEAWMIDENQSQFLLKTKADDSGFFGSDFGLYKIYGDNNFEIIHPLGTGEEPWFCDFSDVFLHPIQPILAFGSSKGEIQIWDIKKGCCLNTLSGHSTFIVKITFSDDGLTLLSADESGSIVCWDLADGVTQARIMWRSEPHSLVIHGVNTDQAIFDSKVENLLLGK